MAYTLLLHLVGEEAIVCDSEQLPSPNDTAVVVNNIRRRDGKDVTFIDSNATTVIFPWTRVSFIEVLGAEEAEEIVGFVRD